MDLSIQNLFINFYEQTYEGHTCYIMNLVFNPKDANTFLSTCLDHAVKMWSLGSSTTNFSMEARAEITDGVEEVFDLLLKCQRGKSKAIFIAEELN